MTLVAFAPELVVASPGFHPDHPLLLWARESGIPVWGDIELAWRVRDKVDGSADWILRHRHERQDHDDAAHRHDARRRRAARRAVPATSACPCSTPSATRAASTCSSSSSRATSCTGSTGTPAGRARPAARASASTSPTTTSTGTARPRPTAPRRRKVYANTRVACVYNSADAATREHGRGRRGRRRAAARSASAWTCPGRATSASSRASSVDRAFLEERHTHALELDTARRARPPPGSPRRTSSRTSSPRRHSRARRGRARRRSATPSAASALDPHRIEVVGRARRHPLGRRLQGHQPARRRTLALVRSRASSGSSGGLLKGVDPDAARRAPRGRLRGAAIVIGVDRSQLVAAFQRHAPRVPVFEVDADETGDVMADGRRAGRGGRRDGDVVLLAPAAASIDQFTDYADRGQAIRRGGRASSWEETVGRRHRPGARHEPRTTSRRRRRGRPPPPTHPARSSLFGASSPPRRPSTSCCSARRSSWSRSAS